MRYTENLGTLNGLYKGSKLRDLKCDLQRSRRVIESHSYALYEIMAKEVAFSAS